MSNQSTIILAPFFFAFLVFALRFYAKEGARSMLNPSFLLAVATLLFVGAYLTLAVTQSLPDYGTLGFAAVGLSLLGLSIYRIFLI